MVLRPSRRSPWLTVPAAVALLLALHGCGGTSSSISVAPSSIDRCGVSVAGGGSPIPAGGGTGTLTVSVERECAWSARSESPWISLTGGQGQGPATITFSVQPNPDASSRRGSVAVEQQKVEIAQEAAPCRYDVSPLSADVGATGGAASIRVSAPGGCPWTAESAVAWLSVEPRNGRGGGAVQVAAAVNGSGARSGNVTIAGAAVQVRQAAAPGPPSPPSPPPAPACRFTLKPTHLEVRARSDHYDVEVKARDGCAWTASSPVGWVRIEGSRGSGEGKVRLQVDENPGPARSTTLISAGEQFSLTQEAPRR
jgi:Viral BACON domain